MILCFTNKTNWRNQNVRNASIFDYVTGRPDEIVSMVLRKISALTRKDRVSYFKIGKYNDPERRFKEEYLSKKAAVGVCFADPNFV